MSNFDTRLTHELHFKGTLAGFQEYLEARRKDMERSGCTAFSIDMTEKESYNGYYDVISLVGIRPESETEKFNRLKREKMREEAEKAREIGVMKHLMNKYKDELL